MNVKAKLTKPIQRGDYKKWLFIDILAILAGIGGGVGAIVFRTTLSLAKTLFFETLLPQISINVSNLNLGMIFLPALGGLIVGLLTRMAPETKGHGVPEVMEAILLRRGKIRKRVAAIKIVASSITISSGGSAGREGPIAQIGAGLGSILGELFKLDAGGMRILVASGLAAGIAGTFNAPLGGALFGLEVLYSGIELLPAIPVILAAVVGAGVASSYFGLKPSFIVPSSLTFRNPAELFWYFVFGLIFGVISVLWVKLFYSIEELFEKIKVHDAVKPAIGGLVTGIIGTLLPSFGIMGVGYEGIDKMLSGEVPLFMLLILGLAKMIATAFSIGSGGSGGIFAPSLYIGTALGGFFGMIFYMITPQIITHPLTFSLAGMASLFAGAAQAPVTVIVMIPEMTEDYALLPPLMASSVTSFLVARMFLKGSSIYTLKLEKRGLRVKTGKPPILESIHVEEIMTKKVITVRADMPLSFLELLVEETGHDQFPVLEEGRLVGIISFREIIKIPAEKRKELKIRDVLDPSKMAVTYPDETAETALEKMLEHQTDILPVVSREKPDKIVGIVTHADIIKAYQLYKREMMGISE